MLIFKQRREKLFQREIAIGQKKIRKIIFRVWRRNWNVVAAALFPREAHADQFSQQWIFGCCLCIKSKAFNLRQLLRELSSLNQLRDSYFEQFKIGERSLLDLLDTQNNRFAAQIAVATSDAAVRFGHFRILASDGSLLKTLGVAAPPQAKTYARKDEKVPETPAADSFVRVDPPAPLE